MGVGEAASDSSDDFMSRKKALGRFVGVTPRFSPTEAGELLHIPLLEQVVGGGIQESPVWVSEEMHLTNQLPDNASSTCTALASTHPGENSPTSAEGGCLLQVSSNK